MTREKADLIIQFDEDRQTLRFVSVPHSAERGRPDGRPHVELDLKSLRGKSADEAERIVGASVLVFFEFHSGTKTGIRDYAAHGREFVKSFREGARQASARNDADAQFEMAMSHLDKSVEDRSRTDLDLAEKWLQTSASNGSASAREYLRDHWQRMKAYAERRIDGK